jgi:hypothetical protein
MLGVAAVLLGGVGSNGIVRADDRANAFLRSASERVAVRHPASRRVYRNRYAPLYYYPGPFGWEYHTDLRNHPYFDWSSHDSSGIGATLPIGPPWTR